ncbi:hypothetical protein SPAB_03918 [Salmonella enterica subsp. enterica serovar Paratyphi B str. SPB7]|uniref:Uncharacterized protein n=1 Tax=Salmonella paratyphi B (strain ATCC BAA-1250 / SPB7) TaxID=1016998 RepID=A0A6C6Z5X7_SALPB|nr:hypothetical protein SPAB_03918 [Salmonella enterica subsp. enterica serovar Paratyphi B str. SPB7]
MSTGFRYFEEQEGGKRVRNLAVTHFSSQSLAADKKQRGC